MAYIWKEWLEQVRGKGLWIGVGMMMVASIFLIAEARSYPADLAFEALLLSIFDMNVYFIPLFGMFLASFSIYQEKELKTAMILLTKKESFMSFFFKKSVAVQTVLIGTFTAAYFILALFMKGFLTFNITSFLYFMVVIILFLFIFTQLGLLLGTMVKTRMQLIGVNILVWFFVVFLIDLIFLYYLPVVTYQNVEAFSWVYFLDPVHALRFFLEVKFDLFSLSHLSQMMEKFLLMDSWKFIVLNAVMWPALFTGVSLLFRRHGARHR